MDRGYNCPHLLDLVVTGTDTNLSYWEVLTITPTASKQEDL